MRLEHVADADVYGSGHDLIRLFDFTPNEVVALIQKIQSTVLNGQGSLELHALEFITPVNCELIFQLSNGDHGLRLNSTGSYICELTVEGYIEMIALMSPFSRRLGSSHQWLYDLKVGGTELLISYTGRW